MAFQASNYTGSLAPADFRGAVFTGVHFQEIAQMSSLCDFHYISEGIPSFMRFWLLITAALRIWFVQTFARPKKRTSQGLGEIDEEITKIGF